MKQLPEVTQHYSCLFTAQYTAQHYKQTKNEQKTTNQCGKNMTPEQLQKLT